MSSAKWYLHLQGETSGPLPTDTVSLMLRQCRLQFSDYIWAEHLTKWHRIEDLDEFAPLLPPYPSVPIPNLKASAPKASVTRTLVPKKVIEKKEIKEKGKSWPKIRRSIRVPVDKETVEISNYGTYEVLNLSEGGIFVKADQLLAIGDDLKFVLRLHNAKEMEMTGIVIRHGIFNDTPGFAIEFTRVNPAHRRVLHEYTETYHPSEE